MDRPEWKTDVDNIIRATKAALSRNPSDAQLFDGKFWQPIHKVLPKFQDTAEIAEKLAEACDALRIRAIKDPNLATSYEMSLVREALYLYETGDTKKKI